VRAPAPLEWRRGSVRQANGGTARPSPSACGRVVFHCTIRAPHGHDQEMHERLGGPLAYIAFLEADIASLKVRLAEKEAG